jgi:hypothetical protein
MDINELKQYTANLLQGKNNYHYFSSNCRKHVIQTILNWMKKINNIITKKYKIEQNTRDAVFVATRLFHRYWKKIGAISTDELKRYFFACYSIAMKYMYDYIDCELMFRDLGYQFVKKDIVSAEFKIMDLVDWKIM